MERGPSLRNESESSSSELSEQDETTDEEQNNPNRTKGAADDAKKSEIEELNKELRKLRIENSNLRRTLNEVGDRVVPTMIKSPDKEYYLAVFDRNIEGKRQLRVTRTQLCELKAFNKKLEEYSRPSNQNADSTSTRYGWLKNSEKLMEIKCPNAVNLWAKIRDDNPHLLYGLRFMNKIKTEFEFLNEDELRKNFDEDFKYQEPSFTNLNLRDADDAVNKCLTPSDEARELICGLIREAVEKNKVKLQPRESEEEVENAEV